MIDPVALIVVGDCCRDFLELAADRIRPGLAHVLALRKRHMRSVIPDETVLHGTVNVAAIMGVGLIDHALVVPDVIRHCYAGHSTTQHCYGFHCIS